MRFAKKKNDRVDQIMSAVDQAGQGLENQSRLFYLFTFCLLCKLSRLFAFFLLSIFCHFLRIIHQVSTVVHKQMVQRVPN